VWGNLEVGWWGATLWGFKGDVEYLNINNDASNEDGIPWLKKRQIHRLLKALSPKRGISSPQKGQRLIPRGISPEAVEHITHYINDQLKTIVEASEEALQEINDNPNSYYLQHRYDLAVIESAIKKVKRQEL
jgi:hypothetical protein